MTRTLTRRELLACLTVAATALGLPAPLQSALADDLAWLKAAVDRTHAGTLAALYRQAVPEEGDPARVLALVREAAGGELTAARLGDLVRREFAEDQIVNVGGWYLARTEARLLILV